MATILFLAHRIPYPPNKGDKLRAYQILEHWSKRHRVFLGCLIEDPEDLQHRTFLRGLCADAYFTRLHPQWALIRACTAFVTRDPLSVWYYRARELATWVRGIVRQKSPTAFLFIHQ